MRETELDMKFQEILNSWTTHELDKNKMLDIRIWTNLTTLGHEKPEL